MSLLMKGLVKVRMKRVKLIALDLDGTLLASDHVTVPQENINAIRNARSNGLLVTISTGRMLEDASDFLRRLNLPCMIISSNGSRVSDGPLPNCEVFSRKCLQPEDARKAIDILLNCGLIVNAFEDGMVATDAQGTGFVYHSVERGLLRAVYGREALYGVAKRGALKLFAVTSRSGQEDAFRLECARSRLRSVLPQLNVTDSGPGFSASGNVEVLPEGSGKGAALSAMATRYGFSPEEVMAIGDADNDISMLKYAYHSVAMGNAPESIKSICRYKTTSNDECGVARAINLVLAAKNVKA